MASPSGSGPLSGIKVIELAGIGPAPFCCMLLADMGAQVIRVDRTIPGDVGVPSDPRYQLLNRGRRSIAIDLKQAAGVDIVKKLIEDADIFVEGEIYYNLVGTNLTGSGSGATWDVQISNGQVTIFDGNSLQFTAPVDMYSNTQIYDRYLLFPKRNILE